MQRARERGPADQRARGPPAALHARADRHPGARSGPCSSGWPGRWPTACRRRARCRGTIFRQNRRADDKTTRSRAFDAIGRQPRPAAGLAGKVNRQEHAMKPRVRWSRFAPLLGVWLLACAPSAGADRTRRPGAAAAGWAARADAGVGRRHRWRRHRRRHGRHGRSSPAAVGRRRQRWQRRGQRGRGSVAAAARAAVAAAAARGHRGQRLAPPGTPTVDRRRKPGGHPCRRPAAWSSGWSPARSGWATTTCA